MRLCPDAVPRVEVPCRAVRGIVFQARASVKVAVAACCVVASLISACSGPPFGPGTSRQQANSSVNCQALARRGVTACPPADPELGSPRLVNHSQGLASPTEFKRYARGLLRTFAYEQFAIDTSQASIYHLGLLATPRATNAVYSDILGSIATAKKEGAKLTNVPAPLTTIKLVALSQLDQSYLRSDGYAATPLAWVVTRSGPSYYFTTKGSSFTVGSSTSSVPAYLYWGSYHASTDLGPIWTFDGSTTCSFDPVWQAVCNQ